MMDAEVSVAMEDWQDIPSSRLPEICAEARKRSDGFIPSNSLVLNTWADIRHREIKAAREAEAKASMAAVVPERSPEELQYIESFFASIRKSLGRGIRSLDSAR